MLRKIYFEIKITGVELLAEKKGDENALINGEWIFNVPVTVNKKDIKECIIPNLTEKQKKFVYANEADVLNVALFGMTAKEWRNSNPNISGNIRDSADILHLVILSNLENLNA